MLDAAGIGILIAAAGLFFTAYGQLKQAATIRLSNLNTVRTKIQDLYMKLSDLLKDPRSRERDQRIRVWDEAFFNELEWLCALFLEGEVSDGLMISHLGPALIRYHDDYFIHQVRQEDSTDPGLYKCFKAVVVELKHRLGWIDLRRTEPTLPTMNTKPEAPSGSVVNRATGARGQRIDLLA